MVLGTLFAWRKLHWLPLGQSPRSTNLEREGEGGREREKKRKRDEREPREESKREEKDVLPAVRVAQALYRGELGLDLRTSVPLAVHGQDGPLGVTRCLVADVDMTHHVLSKVLGDLHAATVVVGWRGGSSVLLLASSYSSSPSSSSSPLHVTHTRPNLEHWSKTSS